MSYTSDLHAAILACNESTLFFTKYFFKKQFSRKYIVGEHHRLIAETLDRVLSGEIKRLIINIAPRFGKTELAVKSFIAKGLSVNPSARFIHLSYSDDLALDNSESVKDLVKSEAYQELYPQVKIKQGSDSKKKWYTTAGGGVYATGAAGQVTGFGAGKVEDEELETELFNGALIIDDPIKPEDADSETIRERVNGRYDSTIKNRVNSRNTPIVIIMQRLHENDLCGHLIDTDANEWTVLSLPCIKEDGTALWEFKHTVEELRKLEKENPIIFGRQYMQNPQPLKGMLFPPMEINYFTPSKLLSDSFESSLAYCDVADEGSDNLACAVGRNVGELTYITDIVFSKLNTDSTLPMVAEQLLKNNAEFCRVESNSFGAMFGRELQKLVPDSQILFIHNSTNKHTRILMQSAHILKYFRFVHPDHQTDDYKAFMKEVMKYMKEVKTQSHDDAPDCLSGLSLFGRSFLSHLYS